MKEFQREFFRLAAWTLKCRLLTMEPLSQPRLEGALQGLRDHCEEMKLLCQEYREK